MTIYYDYMILVISYLTGSQMSETGWMHLLQCGAESEHACKGATLVVSSKDPVRALRQMLFSSTVFEELRVEDTKVVQQPDFTSLRRCGAPPRGVARPLLRRMVC